MRHSVPGPLSAGTAAFPWPAPRRGEADELVWDGVVYSSERGYRPLFVDVHVPDRAPAGSPPPLVVWLHGGGWMQGSRRRRGPHVHRHWLVERTLLAGFALALADYRLAAEARFPAQVADVRAAVRWLRDHADDFGFDPTRVALWGESAGAHLACMAAMSDRPLPGRERDDAAHAPADVQAIAAWYPPADLAAMPRATASGGLPPGGVDVVTALLRRSDWDAAAASPLSYARPGAPPMLIAHGRDDTVVPVEQGRALRDALTAVGADVAYVETDGDHAFEGAPVVDEVIRRTLDFLARRLGPTPARPGQPCAAARPAYPLAAVADATFAGPDGDLAVLVQRPLVPARVVVAHVPADVALARQQVAAGDVASRAAGARIAASTPATVVHVLGAPAPAPAGEGGVRLTDVIATARWAHERLDELGVEALVLAGDGGGGAIAAAAAVACCDAGVDVAALLLVAPTGGSLQAAGDLTGLPPALVAVGAHDAALDDVLTLVGRMREAGVRVTLRAFPALGRGFFAAADASPAADRAAETVCRELAALVRDMR